jgi:hypothetical protein
MASAGSGSRDAYGSPLSPHSEITSLSEITPDSEEFVNQLIDEIQPQSASFWTRDVVVQFAQKIIRNCFAAVGVGPQHHFYSSWGWIRINAYVYLEVDASW